MNEFINNSMITDDTRFLPFESRNETSSKKSS